MQVHNRTFLCSFKRSRHDLSLRQCLVATRNSRFLRGDQPLIAKRKAKHERVKCAKRVRAYVSNSPSSSPTSGSADCAFRILLRISGWTGESACQRR
jgi:hypothetical protein